jgi:allantoinase
VAGTRDACDLSLLGQIPHDSGTFRRGEVRIADGRILSVAADVLDGGYSERIDVGNALLLPGAIDVHVHALSHPGEGFTALTRSALAGGVTTVIEMPFDDGQLIASAAALEGKRARIEQEACADMALLATVAPGDGGASIPELVAAGACGIKVSMFNSHPRRFPRLPDDELMSVFEAAARVGGPVCVHAENDELIRGWIARTRASGRRDPLAHCESRPPVSETQAVLTALEFARATGAHLHLCHLSLPRSVDLASRYLQEGVRVSRETCPHYLVLSEDDMRGDGGARLRINPPLRTRADLDGLWRRVIEGSVDVIGSDHAPWPVELKIADDIFDTRSGVPGVETLVPLVMTHGGRRGLTAARLVELLSGAPARVFGLDHRKGALRPGFDADVIAIDTTTETTITEERLHSNAGWTPYHGTPVSARVALTVARGEVAWDGNRVLVEPGRGRVVLSRDSEQAAAHA